MLQDTCCASAPPPPSFPHPLLHCACASPATQARGTCTITGRTLADKSTCSASANNGGLMLRYPCKPFNGSTPKIQGPAMNLWVSPGVAGKGLSYGCEAILHVRPF